MKQWLMEVPGSGEIGRPFYLFTIEELKALGNSTIFD
jgi:hypothetical protein